MGFKQFLDSVLLCTSSSSVSIVEKTHFTGEYFKKVVDIAEDVNEIKKQADTLDSRFPKDAPHKMLRQDYRIYFKLDLANGPANTTISELIRDANYGDNYTALTERIRPRRVKILGPADDGYRVNFIGYKLCDWLEIETEYVRDGNVLDYLGRIDIKLFRLQYITVREFHNGDDVSLKTETVSVDDFSVNRHVRQLLKWETSIFLKQCSKMMSPG